MEKYFENLYKGSQKDFYNLTQENLKKEKKMFIVTANPETYMKAKKDKELEKIILNKKHTIVADGIGIIKAYKKIKTKPISKITGVDIASKLLEQGNNNKKSIYLLGATEEVINKFVCKIKKDYPNLTIIGYNNGYQDNKEHIFETIIQKEPDIIMVALGIPAQEKLIGKYYPKAKKGIFIGVGGSFDVLSGSKKRAPKMLQKLNLEWLYRIMKEPKRWKRFYQNNIKFLIQTRKK